MTRATDGMPDFEPPSDEEVARQASGSDPALRAVPAPDVRGHEATALGPEAPVPIPPAEPRTRMRRVLDRARHPAVAFVAGLAVATAVLAGVPAISRAIETGTVAELERVIDEYVAAVEAGDVERAVALQPLDPDEADVSVVEAGGAPTVTGTYECGEPRVSGDDADVLCDVTMPQYGSGMSARITLARDGSWRVASGLIEPTTVYIGPGFGTVTSIAGVDVDERVRGGDPIWLLPGQYDTTYTTSDDFEAVGDPSDPTLMAVDGSAYASVYLQPTVEAQQRIDDVAIAFVAGCAETFVPGCPAVEPLAPGQSYEAVQDDGSGYTSDELGSITQRLLVRQVGGTDAHRVTVRVTLGDDDSIDDIQVVGA